MAIWDLGRFAQTLMEFEVLPLSGFVNSLLGTNPTTTAETMVLSMGKILVIGGDRPQNQALTSVLDQRGYLTQQVQPPALSLELLENSDLAIFCIDLTEPEVRDLLKHFQPLEAWRSPSWILFDFRQPSPALANLWGAVDDVVMGGVSASRLQMAAGRAFFTGNVSTENNGGFASVRTKNLPQPWDVSAYEGFRLRVKGDGQRYKFIARCEGGWDNVGYSYSFDTVADQWITVDIPFDDLIPVFRAKSVPERGKFKATHLYAMQLMLSKFEYDGALNPHFQPGNFSLAVSHIAVYGGKPFPRLIVISDHTAYQEQLEELNIPYRLIHCPDGFSPEQFSSVLQTIGDRPS